MITAEKKQEKVTLAKAHAAADRLASGFFTHKKDNRGCSVGCDAYDIRAALGHDWEIGEQPPEGIHAYVANYFGTPEWLEHLRDAIFEGLPKSERSAWHVNIAEALPVGVNFEPIRHRIQRDILLEVAAKSIGEGDEDWRVQCRAAVQSVAALHDKAATKDVQDEEWSAARSAAWSASRSAWSAWSSWSAWSARSAAWSAESAAWSAESARSAAESARSAAESARSAARSAWSARSGWSAAESAAFQKIAEITLKHLREAGAAS